jgi:hypothetical protein
MKREKEHVVPLSAAAVALLESLPSMGKSDIVFPAPRGGTLSDAALGAIIDGMHEADLKRGGTGYLDPSRDKIATPHGFRWSFRDWAAEVAFFPSEVIEHALARKLKDYAEAAYQRGTLLKKRAKLMEDWASYCSVRRDESGKVTPLNRKKARSQFGAGILRHGPGESRDQSVNDALVCAGSHESRLNPSFLSTFSYTAPVSLTKVRARAAVGSAYRHR